MELMSNPFEEFRKKANNEVKTDQDLILLTILSALLASYGIKMDNTYILIGSMLVSPIFDPLISVVILSKLNYTKEFLKAVGSFLMTITLAYLSSLLFWYLESLFSGIEAYTVATPITIDLLIVATIIGFVGVLLWIWEKASNTSAGIAIAISLVPPIANMALGTALGDMSLLANSGMILAINLCGILIGVNFGLLLHKNGSIETEK